MEELNNFKKIKGKQNSLITMIVYDTTQDDLLQFIEKKLDLVKNIKDAFKKKIANDILFKLKCHVENGVESSMNKILLVSEEEVNSFNLTKNYLKVLRDYNKVKIYYETDERYNIGYILDLFNDFNFFTVLELDKKTGSYFEINSTKKKLLESKTINNQLELLELFDNKISILHGNSTLLKSLTTDKIYFNKRLCDDELLEEIDKIVITRNHSKLEFLLSNQSNPEYEDKIIFGQLETKKFTELSMISKLYIHESIYKRYMNVFKEYINFEVYPIKRLKTGDISNTLSNDYDLCVGELYYKKQF